MYAQNFGLNWKSIPLESLDQVMNRRGQDLEQMYLQQNFSPADAKAKALDTLKREFGLR